MNVKPSTVLTMGILGLALSFVYGIGIIFSIIGLSKASAYISYNGSNSGQVKAGKIMSVFGLIISIIVLIVVIIAAVGVAQYA